MYTVERAELNQIACFQYWHTTINHDKSITAQIISSFTFCFLCLEVIKVLSKIFNFAFYFFTVRRMKTVWIVLYKYNKSYYCKIINTELDAQKARVFGPNRRNAWKCITNFVHSILRRAEWMPYSNHLTVSTLLMYATG